MPARLLYFWDRIRSSYWFAPSLMTVAAAVLATVAVRLDGRLELATIEEAGWISAWVYTGGAEGARSVLSTVAGSMITVAGVVFSITIVALTLASSQFGPRVLSNFMRDSVNQVVLGIFVSTFLYCLLVLRTIRSDGEDSSAVVPHVAVTVGLLLAIASLGVLIFFIHHVAVAIQAPTLVATIAHELRESIDQIFPELPDEDDDEEPRPPPPVPEGPAARVVATTGGYLDAVDLAALLETAEKKDLLLWLEYRPGQFVVEGGTLARAWPADAVDDAVMDAVREAHVVGSRRTALQDVEFSIDQLVEVAVRALSPGINDPFTAINCIDHLSAAAARLVTRRLPPPYRCDEAGRPRLVIDRPPTPGGLLDAMFHQIRQNAAGSASVHIRLLEALTRVAGSGPRPEWVEPLRRHAALVMRSGEQGIVEPEDREDLRQRNADFERALRNPR